MVIRAHLKRHKRKYIKLSKWLSFLIIALILLATISPRFHFFVNGEFSISHSPSQLVVKANNNDTLTLQSNISVVSYGFCSSQCTVTVYNDQSNQTVFSKEYNIQGENEQQITFSLDTPANGEGFYFVHVDSRCVNQESLLCPTSQKPFRQSSLFAINYTFDQEEMSVYNKRQGLFEFLNGIYDAYDELLYNIELLSSWNISYNYSTEELESVVFTSDKVVSYWKESELLKARDLFQSIQTDETLDAIDNVADLTARINRYKLNYLTQQEAINNITNLSLNQTYDHYDAYGYPIELIPINELTRDLDFEPTANTAYQTLLSLQTYYDVNITQSQKVVSFYEHVFDVLNIPHVNSSTVCGNLNAINSTLTAYFVFYDTYNRSEVPAAAVYEEAAYRMNETFFSIEPINHNFSSIVKARISPRYVTPLIQDFCNGPFTFEGYNLTILANLSFPNTTVYYDRPLFEDTTKLCCSDDCHECGEIQRPVLLLHGHAFNERNSPLQSLNAFTQIQHQMALDGYVDGGIIDVTDTAALSNGALSLSPEPLVFRGSYYYISYLNFGDYSASVQKSERIENYALRLREIVDEITRITGSDKVDIVAHSMGGLVLRQYISFFGDEAIGEVVTINTPHQGIAGTTQQVCDFFGSYKECSDMSEGSVFLSRLQQDWSSFHVIRSTGCPMSKTIGDGVVYFENAYLPGAAHYTIEGNCTDALGTSLHNDVLDLDLYPQTYDLLIDILD